MVNNELERTYYQIQIWYAQQWVVVMMPDTVIPANFETAGAAFVWKIEWTAQYPNKKFKIVKITEELVG